MGRAIRISANLENTKYRELQISDCHHQRYLKYGSMSLMDIKIETTEDKVAHTLLAAIEDDITAITLSDTNIFKGKTEKLLSLIENYNNVSMTDGLPYMARELFHSLIKFNVGTLNVNLLRAFATMMYSLKIENLINCRDDVERYAYVTEKCDSVLSDYSMYELSGKLGPQPTLYFIKNGLLETHSNDVAYLYSIGFLYRFTLTFKEVINVSYFTPFELPNVPMYKLIGHRSLWRLITNDRNKEIEEFVKR